MSLDRNHTSLVSERLPDGTTRQYTRFWTPEEIAQRQAEEAAWEGQKTQAALERKELAELESIRLREDLARAEAANLSAAAAKIRRDLAVQKGGRR